MKVIGLTGGIASGKSTVARMIEELGVPIIDADILSRKAMEPGMSAWREIKAQWPQVIVPAGRAINRNKLADIVFADERERKKLEAIVHPRVQEYLAARVAHLAAQGIKLAFYECPLLFEMNQHHQYDRNVLVVTTVQTQLERLMARNNLTESAARARINAQMPQFRKAMLATDIIDNTGAIESTERQVKRLVEELDERPVVTLSFTHKQRNMFLRTLNQLNLRSGPQETADFLEGVKRKLSDA